MTDCTAVTIRTELRPGDIGYLIYLHGTLYGTEYGYRLPFDIYVARGFAEFLERYDPERDRAWICEDRGRIVGSIVLMHRDNNIAQLRYFLLEKGYRGMGLGKRLMDLWMEFLSEKGYRGAYLLTAEGLDAAAALYRRYGFALTEETESTIFGIPVKELRYDLFPR